MEIGIAVWQSNFRIWAASAKIEYEALSVPELWASLLLPEVDWLRFSKVQKVSEALFAKI